MSRYQHEDRRRAGIMRDIERRERMNGRIVQYREYNVPDLELEVPPDEISRALWAPDADRPRMPAKASKRPKAPRWAKVAATMLLIVGAPLYVLLRPSTAHAEGPSDYVPAYYLTKNGSRLVLQSEPFGCTTGKRAIVVNAIGGAWVGCWSDDGESIRITWEDGDTLAIPKDAIAQPHEEAHPQRAPERKERAGAV